MSELSTFLAARDKALVELDEGYVARQLPKAPSHLRLVILHKSRYEVTSIDWKLREESRRWLAERGYRRMNGDERGTPVAERRAAKVKPPKSILDPSFRYVPASHTNLEATFYRIRKRLNDAASGNSPTNPGANGRPTGSVLQLPAGRESRRVPERGTGT